MSKADKFLWGMKEKADALTRHDAFKKLLSWAKDKAALVEVGGNKLAAIRSYYIYLDLDLDYIINGPRRRHNALSGLYGLDSELYRAFKIAHALGLDLDSADDLGLDNALRNALYKIEEYNIESYHIAEVLGAGYGDSGHHDNLKGNFAIAHNFAQKKGLNLLVQSLEDLRDRKPPKDELQLEKLTLASRKLREAMIQERNIGHCFKLSETQRTYMKEYLYANKLIVNCLNCQCNVSKSVREEILDTLLIPPGVYK